MIMSDPPNDDISVSFNRASFVEMPNGSKIILNTKDKVQREALAKQLLTPSADPQHQQGCKVVRYRLSSLLNDVSYVYKLN